MLPMIRLFEDHACVRRFGWSPLLQEHANDRREPPPADERPPEALTRTGDFFNFCLNRNKRNPWP